MHPDKTRLIEFGRHAVWKRRRRGAGKPETFDFLGFTHICATNRTGRFWIRRITIAKRMRAKLAEIKVELRRRWHLPIPEQGQWLSAVLRGHYAYYAVARQLRRGKRGMDSSDLWANYQQVEITTRHAQRAEDTPIELEKGAESTSGGAHRLGAARSATALDQAPTVTPEEPHPIQS